MTSRRRAKTAPQAQEIPDLLHESTVKFTKLVKEASDKIMKDYPKSRVSELVEENFQACIREAAEEILHVEIYGPGDVHLHDGPLEKAFDAYLEEKMKEVIPRLNDLVEKHWAKVEKKIVTTMAREYERAFEDQVKELFDAASKQRARRVVVEHFTRLGLEAHMLEKDFEDFTR